MEGVGGDDSTAHLVPYFVCLALYIPYGVYHVSARLGGKNRAQWTATTTVHLILTLIAAQTAKNLVDLIQASGELEPYDPWAILGVEKGAGADEVKRAWREAALQFHPDKAGSSDEDRLRYLAVKKAKEALTDPVAARNFAEHGHPDGPQVVTIGMALPSWMQPGGLADGSSQLAVVFGYLLVLFVAMGSFAWWRNRAHDASEKKQIGVLKEDIECLARVVKEDAEIHDVLVALIRNPAMTRSLKNLRLQVRDETMKRSGGEVGALMVAEREEEDWGAFGFLRAELEACGALPLRVGDGDEVLDVGGKDEQAHVALLVLGRLWKRFIGTERLEEAMTPSVMREWEVLTKIGARLLDRLLVEIVLSRRWLKASHSTLRFTGTFATALWSHDDEKAIEIMNGLLAEKHLPMPDLKLTAFADQRGDDGEGNDAGEAFTEGADADELVVMKPQEDVTLRITLERRHLQAVKDSRRMGAADEQEEEEGDKEGGKDDEEDVDGGDGERAVPLKVAPEPYWVIVEMSNGTDVRFAAVQPVFVQGQTLLQPAIKMQMPMKAPVAPGPYSIKFRLFSPIVLGCEAECTLRISVVSEEEEENEDDWEEIEPLEGAAE